MELDTKAGDDRTTVAALGALAFILTMLLHEAIGHAGMNVLLFERSIVYPQWTKSSSQSAAMIAAGPIANFVGGMIFYVAHLCNPPLRAHGKYFLWLSAAFNLFNAAGYLLLGSLTGFGDWGYLFQEWHINLPTSWAIAILAAALYYGFMWMISYRADFGPQRGRRLTMIPYAAAGLVACSAAAVSAQGLGMVLVGAAASFGAGIGLVVIGDWNGRRSTADADFLVYSRGWVATSFVFSLFYIVVIGRGLVI